MTTDANWTPAFQASSSDLRFKLIEVCDLSLYCERSSRVPTVLPDASQQAVQFDSAFMQCMKAGMSLPCPDVCSLFLTALEQANLMPWCMFARFQQGVTPFYTWPQAHDYVLQPCNVSLRCIWNTRTRRFVPVTPNTSSAPVLPSTRNAPTPDTSAVSTQSGPLVFPASQVSWDLQHPELELHLRLSDLALHTSQHQWRDTVAAARLLMPPVCYDASQPFRPPGTIAEAIRQRQENACAVTGSPPAQPFWHWAIECVRREVRALHASPLLWAVRVVQYRDLRKRRQKQLAANRFVTADTTASLQVWY